MPRTTLKMAALAPMPSASVTTTVSARPLAWRSARIANFRSCMGASLKAQGYRLWAAGLNRLRTAGWRVPSSGDRGFGLLRASFRPEAGRRESAFGRRVSGIDLPTRGLVATVAAAQKHDAWVDANRVVVIEAEQASKSGPHTRKKFSRLWMSDAFFKRFPAASHKFLELLYRTVQVPPPATPRRGRYARL